MPIKADGTASGPRSVARTALALALANVRYWRTVAPLVRGELERWRAHAQTIEDHALRTLALSKLDGEAFNAEAGAMLATLAPVGQRRNVVEAIVALQVLFDLLDGLTERPTADPLADGERLFGPFIDALRPLPQVDTSVPTPDAYLSALSRAAADAVARLPARAGVADAALLSAQRAARAQILMHAASTLGTGALRNWAEPQAQSVGLPWRELAAGSASSVLAIHALIAAAADDRTSPVEASRIASAYLSICVLLTLLDGLTDRELDVRNGEPGYVDLYESTELLAGALEQTADRAVTEVRSLPAPPST